MEKYFLCTYHQMMLIFTYWALGTGLGGQWPHLNPKSSLNTCLTLNLSVNLSVALIHRGGNGSIQRLLTARFTVTTQEKCLAFICSFTAPTFILFIEECCYEHFLEMWLAFYSPYSLQKSSFTFSVFSPCFLSFLNHFTQPGVIVFFFFFYYLFIWLCRILAVACTIFIASWGIFHWSAQTLQ